MSNSLTYQNQHLDHAAQTDMSAGETQQQGTSLAQLQQKQAYEKLAGKTSRKILCQ